MSEIESRSAKELLVRLVEIPSVTYSENEACVYLAQALPMHGWEDAHIDAVGNVVALGSGPVFTALLEWLVAKSLSETSPPSWSLRVNAGAGCPAAMAMVVSS